MSKRRSDFERVERDFYPTPRKAVLPLIPHLDGIRRFAEPCCGDGRLVRHLESFGLHCTLASDIHGTGQDALDLTAADIGGAVIITNPPFSKPSQPLLRRLIAHFQRIAPATWLLLPADFASNRWFARLLPSCSDIVAIGRVRWFEGTEGMSFENFAWHRFEARHTAGPVFHGRDSALTSPRARLCAGCGRPYLPTRSDALTCSNACRQRAYRQRLKCNANVTHEGVSDARPG